MREASNRALSGVPQDVLLVVLVLSVAVAGFGLGMLSERQMNAEKGSGFWIEQVASSSPAVLGAAVAGATASAIATKASEGTAESISAPMAVGKYVASKNGTKYYLPTCSGAKRIKDENKVWFATVEEARASGRTPSSACKGI